MVSLVQISAQTDSHDRAASVRANAKQENGTRSVGLLGRDYPGTIFDAQVTSGSVVAAGDVVARDRHRPEICLTAPVAGRIVRIETGIHRRLELAQIDCEGDIARRFETGGLKGTFASEGLRRLLLESGCWSGLRSRPFGRLPHPKDLPSAIFVFAGNAAFPASEASDVGEVAEVYFRRGIEALLELTPGQVFLCQLHGTAPVHDGARLKVIASDPRRCTTEGSVIHRVFPVSGRRSVWQVGLQEVIAIGHLLETGQVMGWREVTISRSGSGAPVAIRAPLGARLSDLAAHLSPTAALRRPRPLPSLEKDQGTEDTFLGRHDLAVLVTDPGSPANHPALPLWHRLLGAIPTARSGAIIPGEAFERHFPFDLLPAPLMRALAIGDVESAERLGCLELLEEDVACLSRLCPSGNDYGQLLRLVLDALAEETAP